MSDEILKEIPDTKETKPSATINERVEKLAIKLSQSEDTIEDLEKKLANEKKSNDKIKTELVELMELEGYAIGSTLVLNNGRILKLKEFFSCGIPTEAKIDKEKDAEKRDALIEKKDSCFKWLTENGLDGIIKSTITASFDKGEDEKIDEIIQILTDKEITCMSDTNVNAATLKATLKEVMKSGKDIPFELFEVYTGMIVEIK